MGAVLASQLKTTWFCVSYCRELGCGWHWDTVSCCCGPGSLCITGGVTHRGGLQSCDARAGRPDTQTRFVFPVRHLFLLWTSVVKCLLKRPKPRLLSATAFRAEGTAISPATSSAFKKNILHHKPFDEERKREPLMKYVNLGKAGTYEREY